MPWPRTGPWPVRNQGTKTGGEQQANKGHFICFYSHSSAIASITPSAPPQVIRHQIPTGAPVSGAKKVGDASFKKLLLVYCACVWGWGIKKEKFVIIWKGCYNTLWFSINLFMWGWIVLLYFNQNINLQQIEHKSRYYTNKRDLQNYKTMKVSSIIFFLEVLLIFKKHFICFHI